MKISRKSIGQFHAKVSFGLNRLYSEELLLKEDVIKSIQSYQAKLISETYLLVGICFRCADRFAKSKRTASDFKLHQLSDISLEPFETQTGN